MTEITGPDHAFEKYNALKTLGVTNQVLMKSARHKYLNKSEVEPYARLLYKLPKSGYREFLKVFVRAYFPKAFDETANNGKFYDKFYISNKKKLR